MSDAELFARDFDDLEAGIKATTRGRTITEADLTSFSALTGDWHRQHSDAAWAEQSPFGERIAHGMLVLSYAIGLLPIDDERVMALRGIRQLVFKRPAAIGSTIHARVELSDTKPLDAGHGLVSMRVDVRDGEERLLVRGTIDALWRRGASPAWNGSANDVAIEAEPSPFVDGRLCI
jgi:3-hydroxybutyryl-CoA dehydratase